MSEYLHHDSAESGAELRFLTALPRVHHDLKHGCEGLHHQL